jgi:hypothetical protein
VEGPVEITARIHAEAAKRERYFSRDYVAGVAVLCSQNTHDFYGHIPDTSNLADYRDGLLGTWMALTENHVPFEFIFDNQLESAIPARYKTLLLPNAAAMSEAAARSILDWTRAGGHLVVTAETSRYDEWGNRLPRPRLEILDGLRITGNVTSGKVGKGMVTWFPEDPGLRYCRTHEQQDAANLCQAINRPSIPFTIEAPPTLVANMFRSPDKSQYWVHLLNVSHLMPNGDNGFRGLDRPAAFEPGPDVENLVSARDVVLTVKDEPVSAARLVVAGQSLDVKDRSTITIPQVKLHEIVVLEIAP